jgi:hypothetical protein
MPQHSVEMNSDEQPSRWRQMFGRAREAQVLDEATNQSESWIDEWQRELLLKNAKKSLHDDDHDNNNENMFDTSWTTNQDEDPVVASVPEDIKAEAHKHIQAWLHVEKTAGQIKYDNNIIFLDVLICALAHIYAYISAFIDM